MTIDTMSWLDSAIVSRLDSLRVVTPSSFTAGEFQRAAEYVIQEALGGEVARGVKVRTRGDGRPGKVDLVVNGVLAIELDYRTPRKKSIEKIKAWDGPGLVYCRASGEVWRKP